MTVPRVVLSEHSASAVAGMLMRCGSYLRDELLSAPEERHHSCLLPSTTWAVNEHVRKVSADANQTANDCGRGRKIRIQRRASCALSSSPRYIVCCFVKDLSSRSATATTLSEWNSWQWLCCAGASQLAAQPSQLARTRRTPATAHARENEHLMRDVSSSYQMVGGSSCDADDARDRKGTSMSYLSTKFPNCLLCTGIHRWRRPSLAAEAYGDV
eukprot:120408-Pleurochrysis_carterae.AAC.1